jgi:hypothetical protein
MLLFIAVTIYLRKQFISVHSSEVSVHAQLAPLLLGCDVAEHHGGSAWWSKAAHLLLLFIISFF